MPLALSSFCTCAFRNLSLCSARGAVWANAPGGGRWWKKPHQSRIPASLTLPRPPSAPRLSSPSFCRAAKSNLTILDIDHLYIGVAVADAGAWVQHALFACELLGETSVNL